MEHRRALLGELLVAGDLLVGLLVDDRPEEALRITDVTDHDVLELGADPVAHLREERLRQVEARRRRALLALVLVAAADDGRGELGRIGARVGDDEVLAAGLADDARVRSVAVQVARDALPEGLEGPGRASEVDARQVLAGEARLALRRPVAGDELDDTVGQTGFTEQLEHVPGADHRGHRGLPEHHVAHERRGGRQVAGDGREVERRDGEHEALERPVVGPVPAGARGA